MVQCKNCYRWVDEQDIDTGGECSLCNITRKVCKGHGYLEENGKKILEVKPINLNQK